MRMKWTTTQRTQLSTRLSCSEWRNIKLSYILTKYFIFISGSIYLFEIGYIEHWRDVVFNSNSKLLFSLL